MQEVSGGGNPGSTGEDVIEVSSTTLEVRELHGLSRCVACQTEDRSCYVEQRSMQCLRCRLPTDCLFRRTVERSINALSWAELTGTIAGQKRHLEDSEPSVDRKLRPIEVPRPAAVNNVERPVNGRATHDMTAPSPGWYPHMEQASRPSFPPVHIKPLNLDASDSRMIRRIPVALPPPPPAVKREHQDRNGSPRTDPALYCEQCQVHFSTNSEYSKHMSRHTKRFRCDVAGCKKIDGFATLNDLDRHKKSVHGAYDVEDPVWKCFVDGCKSRDKIWPRQDNFKAHLERMHRGVDVEQYVKISDRWLEDTERPRRLEAKMAAEKPELQNRKGSLDGQKDDKASMRQLRPASAS